MEEKSGKDVYGTFSSGASLTGAGGVLSASMEDYLEMIYRISKEGRAVRVRDVSASLGVSPSSVSRMTGALKVKGLVNFEKYGYITLTENGKVTGAKLLHRHEVVNSFLCLLNGSEDELRQTEQIEHYLTDATVANMERFIKESKK